MGSLPGISAEPPAGLDPYSASFGNGTKEDLTCFRPIEGGVPQPYRITGERDETIGVDLGDGTLVQTRVGEFRKAECPRLKLFRCLGCPGAALSVIELARKFYTNT